MIHATRLLSDFAEGLTFDALGAEVVETTKRFVVDYYAACFAGMKINAAFNRAVEAEILEMGGAQECDTLLSERRIPCLNAAFLNAVYSHGADLDDGNRKAMGHIGAHVMSAVLTLAQTLDVTGRDVITAINVGYEVYNRVAAAAQPGLVHRGFHSTGTAGAVACAAASAKLMGLDGEGIYNSMAIAAVQASGLIIIAESGQCCKPLNPANAARTGILAARLAKRGVIGPVYPLESPKGWFHAMCDAPDARMITDGLGETFTIRESYMKPYPSCRHTHAGIDAALAIRRRMGEGEQIESVDVYIYPNAIQIAGQIRVPAVEGDSKFSIHYALATALAKGRFGLDELKPEALDDAVKDIIARTELIPDEAMERRDEGIRGARVVVKTRRGNAYEETILIPKGDADNPLTLEDLRAKLGSCAGGILDDAQQRALVENVLRLDALERVKTINLYR